MLSLGGGIYVSNGAVMTGCNHVAPIRLGATSHVTINGERIAGPCTVEVRQGVLYIDGKPRDKKAGETGIRVSIDIVGNVDAGGIKLDMGTVSVTGNVSGGIATASGDVSVDGDVPTGSVSTMSGNVEVGGSVAGSATSMSGNVTVGGTAGAASSISGRVRQTAATVVRRTQHRAPRATPLRATDENTFRVEEID